METYLRIRNNLFLVWGGDAPNPLHSIPLCRPSRPGKTKSRQRFAVGIPFYWVQLETFVHLGVPSWKPCADLGHARGYAGVIVFLIAQVAEHAGGVAAAELT